MLYSFTGASDGNEPAGDILRDDNNNLFGTAWHGGVGDHGVVFKLAPDGVESVLHSFNGNDGDVPQGLTRDTATGDFYGVTYNGGGASGVIYKLTPEGTETVLHIFRGSDGAFPSGLKRDEAGNLYGATTGGGANNCGTIYKLAADGTFSLLHEFLGSDGCIPTGRLLEDGLGNFYGTTQNGGTHCGHSGGCGVVFMLAQGGSYAVLHDFTYHEDGRTPLGLARDKAGNLYGAAYSGGGIKNCNGYCGLLFKLASNGTFAVLHVFRGGADGGNPDNLMRSHSGTFYGTTEHGGGNGCGGYGCGTVFRMTQDGTVTTLHGFADSKRDGEVPSSGLLIEHHDRRIYGVTLRGGAYDFGTVYELKK